MSSECPNKIEAFTFDRNVNEVANDLIGAIILTADKRFLVMTTSAFESDDIKRKEFQSAKSSLPGTVTGSPYRGKQTFANISTSENGLVMPTAIVQMDIYGESTLIEGPSRVAKALGVEQDGQYSLFIQDPYSKIFYLTTTIPEDEGNLLNNL